MHMTWFDWYPHVALVWSPLVFFVAMWVSYASYSVSQNHAASSDGVVDGDDGRPARMITEFFEDEPFASSLVAGVPVTLMCAGMFASGVLLDHVDVRASSGEVLTASTPVLLYFSMGPLLKLISFLFILSTWTVIATSDFKGQEWLHATHAVTAVTFMVSGMLTLWVAYAALDALLPKRPRPCALSPKMLAVGCEVLCAAGILLAAFGFGLAGPGPTGPLLIATGELVILGALTVAFCVILYMLASLLQGAALVPARVAAPPHQPGALAMAFQLF